MTPHKIEFMLWKHEVGIIIGLRKEFNSEKYYRLIKYLDL
jgi:hypothetical protein